QRSYHVEKEVAQRHSGVWTGLWGESHPPAVCNQIRMQRGFCCRNLLPIPRGDSPLGSQGFKFLAARAALARRRTLSARLRIAGGGVLCGRGLFFPAQVIDRT